MDEITLVIPIKPVNGKGKRAAEYREKAAPYIPDLHPTPKDHSKKYMLTVEFCYIGECNGDMDNRLLCIFDALKGKVIYDDFQVKELHCFMREHGKWTGTKVYLKQISSKADPEKEI